MTRSAWIPALLITIAALVSAAPTALADHGGHHYWRLPAGCVELDLSNCQFGGNPGGETRPPPDPEVRWDGSGLCLFVEGVGTLQLLEGPPPQGVPVFRVAILAPDGTLVVEVGGARVVALP